MTCQFSVRVKKLLQGSVSHEFTVYLSEFYLVILSKAYKPDNFESENSLKRRLTNIQGLYINFIGWVFFLESNYPDILA